MTTNKTIPIQHSGKHPDVQWGGDPELARYVARLMKEIEVESSEFVHQARIISKEEAARRERREKLKQYQKSLIRRIKELIAECLSIEEALSLEKNK